MDEPDAAGRSDEGTCRVKPRIPATQAGQLRAAGGGVPGLVQYLMPGGGDLITAYHHRPRVARGYFLGFRRGQSQGPLGRGFAGMMILGDLRPDGLEGQTEPLQELAPVGGGGGQDQWVHFGPRKQRLRYAKDFDLSTFDTYYTRPMSPPRSKTQAHVGLDVDRLSAAEADVDFVVPLGELPRLRAQLAQVAGEVHGRVHFRRQAGIAVAELALSGTARLVCQRCLEEMDLTIEAEAQVGLIVAEADASRVPEELEPVLAPEGRISVGELVEEELLLTLPIVPLHADAGDGSCVIAPEAPLATDGREEETQRPFAQLAELLKRQ